MSPHFLSDSFVFSLVHWRQSYKVGDVILVNHAIYGKMIKRIATINVHQDISQSISEETSTLNSSSTTIKNIRSVLLIGDNYHSVSTQQMGEVLPTQIIGKVVYHVKANT